VASVPGFVPFVFFVVQLIAARLMTKQIY